MAIVKALNWSEHSPPNADCRYDHISAETINQAVNILLGNASQ